jgi:hypothetical protein
MAQTLVVLHGGPFTYQNVQMFFGNNYVSTASADITTDPAALGAAAKYSKACILALSGDSSFQLVLSAVNMLLTPGAAVSATLLPKQGAVQTDVSSALLLSGFINCQSSCTDGVTQVTAQTPDFAVGAKDSIRLKPKPAAAAAAAKPAGNAWLLAGDDLDGEELLDDEELLTEEDRQRPAVSKQDDCEVGAGGARKACKNCSCGRAEAEAKGEKVQLTQEMLDNPQSSCGNCSLGDAFRCAGCPYRGLPAFETGKPIQLPADFLTADA